VDGSIRPIWVDNLIQHIEIIFPILTAPSTLARGPNI
jgi:hypothetical protein